MIVIEGMDNSGKSTLARHIIRWFTELTIQESEGPPGSGDEINQRIRRYSLMRNTLFVRHPCVSNPIYDLVRPAGDSCKIDQTLIDQFYDSEPIFIYCDPLDRALQGHEEKGHDSAEHLSQVTQGYVTLLLAYQKWAIRHAHVIYRIGDDMERISTMLIGID